MAGFPMCSVIAWEDFIEYNNLTRAMQLWLFTNFPHCYVFVIMYNAL